MIDYYKYLRCPECVENGLYCKPECIEQRLEHVVEENNEIDRQDFRIRQFSGGLNAEILTLASF